MNPTGPVTLAVVVALFVFAVAVGVGEARARLPGRTWARGRRHRPRQDARAYDVWHEREPPAPGMARDEPAPSVTDDERHPVAPLILELMKKRRERMESDGFPG